jgi:ubiquinone/menaquinone biosynthesis C-methylase UbiE
LTGKSGLNTPRHHSKWRRARLQSYNFNLKSVKYMVYIPSGTELLNPAEILKRVGVAEGMKVADMGCGSSGHFVFPAARIVGGGGKVYAVDLLKSALAGVESRRKMEGVVNVEEVWSDIEVYGGAKIPDKSLDVVLLVNNQPNEAMLKESARLVKDGGRLAIVDWEKVAAPFGPPTKDRLDKEETKKRVEALGLKFSEEFKAGPYHFGLVFVK